MRPALHRPRMSRALSLTLLVAVLGLGSLTLTQCKMVADRIVGVDVLHNRRPGECLRECRDEYREDVERENDKHRERVRKCRRNTDCLDQEEARHLAALADLRKVRDDCINSCHHQGGGDGGR